MAKRKIDNEERNQGYVTLPGKPTGNTNGVNNRFTSEQKLNMTLTSEQQEVAVGLMLNDGSLTKGRDGTSLDFDQSATKNVGYFLHVLTIYFDLLASMSSLNSHWHNIYSKYTYSWKLHTPQLPCLNWLYFLFYDETGKRRIHPDIVQHITPCVLAHWI